MLKSNYDFLKYCQEPINKWCDCEPMEMIVMRSDLICDSSNFWYLGWWFPGIPIYVVQSLGAPYDQGTTCYHHVACTFLVIMAVKCRVFWPLVDSRLGLARLWYPGTLLTKLAVILEGLLTKVQRAFIHVGQSPSHFPGQDDTIWCSSLHAAYDT